ncbi:hypothetical protein GCM10009863_44670 [Streptomyces axinellae]|uniref:Uncharacterized protein n=1 Tax=Streptomyces axinellae TaxID=552788 RepID=A0ABN3QFE0_9ACTN
MLGSATFTMVTSTSRMKAPRQTANRGHHLRISGSPFGSDRVGSVRIGSGVRAVQEEGRDGDNGMGRGRTGPDLEGAGRDGGGTPSGR